MDLPTPGEIVLFALAGADIAHLASRGVRGVDDSKPLPMIVTGVHGVMLSGHVQLNGPGTLWVHNIPYGTGPGCWQWRGKTKQA